MIFGLMYLNPLKGMVQAIAGKNTTFVVDVTFALAVSAGITVGGLGLLRQIRSQRKRLREQRVEIRTLEAENDDLRDKNEDLWSQLNDTKGSEGDQ